MLPEDCIMPVDVKKYVEAMHRLYKTMAWKQELEDQDVVNKII